MFLVHNDFIIIIFHSIVMEQNFMKPDITFYTRDTAISFFPPAYNRYLIKLSKDLMPISATTNKRLFSLKQEVEEF